MKSIIKYSLVAIAFCTVFASRPVSFYNNQAQATPQQRVALVTIRFNQKRVSYHNQLYAAIVEAVKVKPSVVFDVVGYSPITDDQENNAIYRENTQSYLNRVANDMKKMGVNPQQVNVNLQSSQSIKHEEVKIFVR